MPELIDLQGFIGDLSRLFDLVPITSVVFVFNLRYSFQRLHQRLDPGGEGGVKLVEVFLSMNSVMLRPVFLGGKTL